ncbi:MAG TPA: NYN domain-containing protein [Thermoanaerobaculia bacterium]|nr:NYN domain-containing protein [Thermoanaerobaculia bacterium]
MPDMIESSCSKCGYAQKVNSKFAGHQWRCASCGEEYSVARTTTLPVALQPDDAADPTTAEPFQTAAPEILLSGGSIFDEPLPGGTPSGAKSLPKTDDVAPKKAEILRSFMQLDWHRLADRDFFRTFPTFCDKIAELRPLLAPQLARALPQRLADARRRWQAGQSAPTGKRPPVSEQGLPQLADICVNVGTALLNGGDYEFVAPLASVAVSGYFIPGLPRHADALLRAFRLQSVANIVRKKNLFDFEAVLESVRADAQNLRRRTIGKRIAPRPEQLSEAIDQVVYQYFTMVIRDTRNAPQAQHIASAAFVYVCRLLGERGRWDEMRQWISLCKSADQDSVETPRAMGLLVEDDPLALPGKTTQAEFMTCVENRDFSGALAVLTPWVATLRTRLQNAANLFRAYRTPESNYLSIDGKPEPSLMTILNRAVSSYLKGNSRVALAALKELPAIGDVGSHPLIREWRALVNAKVGALAQAESLLRASLASGFVLEDTAWNLSVLLAQDSGLASQQAALQVLREYLKVEDVRLYEGGAVRETSGRHILANNATTFTMTALSLATGNESFIVELVLNTPRGELRMYDRLLPLAFVLAASSGHSQQNELRDRLISLWAGGGEEFEWADAKARISATELEGYVNRTGGDLLELAKLSEYLEQRKRYEGGRSPLLNRKLADIYQALEKPVKELEARVDLVLALSNIRASEQEQRDAVIDALKTADENDDEHKPTFAALERLESALTKIGKRAWLKGFEHLYRAKPEQKPQKPEKSTERPAAPIVPPPITPKPPVRNRLTLEDATKEADVDADVSLEVVTPSIVNDVDESDFVLRIANTRPSRLTDVELYLEFKPASVHSGSRYATVASPHALKERDPGTVTYETIPVHCPPEVQSVAVSAALVYKVDGQRRYKQAATVRLPATAFSDVTQCSGGIPHELYFYGGMVSQNYAHTFQGREKLRDELLDCIRAGNMTHFLDGIKRVGKSSVCANLVYEPASDVIAVHLDLDDYALGDEKVNTQVFCQRLLRDIAAALMARRYDELPTVSVQRWETEPSTVVFKDVLRQYAAAVAPARILLMFDEVQALLASVENNQRVRDSNKYVRKDFLDMLSAMLNDAHRPAQLLFTASERYETVKSGGTYNVFNRVTPINLGFLDESATGNILAAGVRNTGIRYTPEAVASVWRHLRGYPAHVQQMGDKLMDRLRARHRTVVLPQDVTDVADELVSDSILFDYQCNRDTIGREQATMLEAIFKGQEELYGGRRAGTGRGVPMRELAKFAGGLEAARIPAIKKALESQQVIADEWDSEGQLIVRINGLLMEMWLAHLRDERGALREDVFPMKRPSIFHQAQAAAISSPERRGCVVFVDFENIARDEAVRNSFLGHVDAKKAAEEFHSRLVAACAAAGYDLRDKRIVAPWSIEELTAYQDIFEHLGMKPVNCLKGVKNAADFALMQTLLEMLPFFLSTGVGTLLLISADNDFAQTLTRSKGAGLRTVVWGIWKNRRPSRSLLATADLTQHLLDMLYPKVSAPAPSLYGSV